MSSKRINVVRRKLSPRERWILQEKIREAEVAYITDRQRQSAEHWWEKLCSDVMPLPKFMERVRRGQWAQRREAYWEEVTQEILRRSKYAAVRDSVSNLQEIEKLRGDVLDVMTPKIINGRKVYPVRPGTFEGMVGAFVKLDKLASDNRDRVLTMIEPELIEQTDEGQSSQFTPDEWRAVASMLLEKQREKQQQLLGASNGEDPQEKVRDQKDDQESHD